MYSCKFLLVIISVPLISGDVLRYLPKEELKEIKSSNLFSYLKSLLDPSSFENVNYFPSDRESIYSGRIKTNFGQVGKYAFKNCGVESQEMFDLQYLNISPDPLVFPGTLTVSFVGQAKKDINSPVQANVTLANVKAGKYPCVDGIGSCDYKDLCALLANIPSCPPPLVSAGIPCKCPIPAGSYKLKEASFAVQAVVLPPGDYMARANMTQGTSSVGCYEVYVSFACKYLMVLFFTDLHWKP